MIELRMNDAQLAELLKKLDDLNMKKITGPVFGPTGQAIETKTGVYPAPVASYDRTGQLRASWWHTAFPNYLKVGNLAAYAGWVHGPLQMGYHKQHGWKQLWQTAKAEIPELVRKLEARILAIWRA
jgi:hypothetical protein